MGRFLVTDTAADEYVFRAAPLRNIAATAPCFHFGAVWNLSTAVEIMAESQLGAQLAVEEADAIVTFLGSLTGEMPEMVYPLLPPETADTPRPTGAVIE
jgi:cytochrome c peroxidase